MIRNAPAARKSVVSPFSEQLTFWLVRNRNFVLLWAAYGVAAFGDHLSEIALLKERRAFDREDLTRVQALITFGFFLPFVLLGPLAGWWCDRFSRKGTMIVADLLRAALVFNLAAIVAGLTRALPPAWGDHAIVLPLVAVGTLAAFFSPARQALLPTLIRSDQLVRANALISALGTIGGILSAVVGGYLVQRLGPQQNYHLNALTFVLSAACVAGIAMARTRAAPHPPLAGVWAPVRACLHYVRTHGRVGQLIGLATVYWAAAGVVISVIPAIARLYYGEDYSAAGTLRGVLVFGLACGAGAMTLLGPALSIPTTIRLGLGLAAVWLLGLAVTVVLKLGPRADLGPVPAGVCLFGIGGAGAALLVTIMACLQRFVPDSRRGRVFGVADTCTMAAIVASTGLLGLPRFEQLDRYIPMLLGVTAAGMLLALVVAERQHRAWSRRPRSTP